MKYITLRDFHTLKNNHMREKLIEVIRKGIIDNEFCDLAIFYFDSEGRSMLTTAITDGISTNLMLELDTRLPLLNRQEMMDEGHDFLFNQEQMAKQVPLNELEFTARMRSPEGVDYNHVGTITGPYRETPARAGFEDSMFLAFAVYQCIQDGLAGDYRVITELGSLAYPEKSVISLYLAREIPSQDIGEKK